MWSVCARVACLCGQSAVMAYIEGQPVFSRWPWWWLEVTSLTAWLKVRNVQWRVLMIICLLWRDLRWVASLFVEIMEISTALWWWPPLLTKMCRGLMTVVMFGSAFGCFLCQGHTTSVFNLHLEFSHSLIFFGCLSDYHSFPRPRSCMHKLNPFTAMVLLKKRLIKVQNLKFLSLFVFFFTLSLPCERIFIKTHGIESRSVIGPQNTMFAGTFVYFSAWVFFKMGQ